MGAKKPLSLNSPAPMSIQAAQRWQSPLWLFIWTESFMARTQCAKGKAQIATSQAAGFNRLHKLRVRQLKALAE